MQYVHIDCKSPHCVDEAKKISYTQFNPNRSAVAIRQHLIFYIHFSIQILRGASSKMKSEIWQRWPDTGSPRSASLVRSYRSTVRSNSLSVNSIFGLFTFWLVDIFIVSAMRSKMAALVDIFHLHQQTACPLCIHYANNLVYDMLAVPIEKVHN